MSTNVAYPPIADFNTDLTSTYKIPKNPVLEYSYELPIVNQELHVSV